MNHGNITTKTSQDRLSNTLVAPATENKLFNEVQEYKEIFRPTYLHLLKIVDKDLPNKKAQYVGTMRKNSEVYLNAVAYVMFKSIKAKNRFNNFKNKTLENQKKYLNIHKKAPEPYFYLLNNPTDYNEKSNRCKGFYEEVKMYGVTYQQIHLALRFVKDTGLAKVIPGVNAEKDNRHATHVYANEIQCWKISEDVTFEEYLKLIEPGLTLKRKGKEQSVLIKDMTRDADGRKLQIIRGKYKKIENNLLLEVPKNETNFVDKLNSYIPEGLEQYYFQRIYHNDQMNNGKYDTSYTCGRFISLFSRMTRKERKYICKRFGLVEVDLSMNNLNIIWYMVTGHKYPGDLYQDIAIELWGDENPKLYRQIIKKFIITLPGAKSREEAQGSICEDMIKIGMMRADGENFKEQYKRRKEWLKDEGFPEDTEMQYKSAKEIQLAIEKVCRPIREQLYLGLNPILQFIEAKIMEKNLQFQIDKKQFLNSLHDGFMVSKEIEGEANVEIERNFLEASDENKRYFFRKARILRKEKRYRQKDQRKKEIEKRKRSRKKYRRRKSYNKIRREKYRKEGRILNKKKKGDKGKLNTPQCLLSNYYNNLQFDYNFSFP